MRLTVNKPLLPILKKPTWWTTVLKAAYLLLEEVPTLLVPWGPISMISNQKWSISNTKRFEGPHLKWRTGGPLGSFWQADIWCHSLERHINVLASLVLNALIVLQVFFGLNLQTNSVDDLGVDLFPTQKSWDSLKQSPEAHAHTDRIPSFSIRGYWRFPPHRAVLVPNLHLTWVWSEPAFRKA